MTIDLVPSNSTQWMGLLSFLSSTALSAFAAWRVPEAARKVWWGIASLQLLFSAEIMWSGRHHLHLWVNAALMKVGLYRDRQVIQLALLCSLAALLVVALKRLPALRALGACARLAVGATVLTLTLFAIETTSLHAIDAVMYRRIGPVALIACVWMVLAAATAAAALRAGMMVAGRRS